MSKDQTALLPCPFCGEPATLEGCGYEGAADVNAIYAECVSCGAQGGSHLVDRSEGDDEAYAVSEATSSWNRRATPGGYPENIDNPDDWARFLARYLDNRATNAVHDGIGLVALHIVDAVRDARRGVK